LRMQFVLDCCFIFKENVKTNKVHGATDFVSIGYAAGLSMGRAARPPDRPSHPPDKGQTCID
jgi:hypothetical protein